MTMHALSLTLRDTVELPCSPISLALSADDRWVAMTGVDKKLRIRDAASLAEVKAIHVGRRPAALCFSPDSRLVVAGATSLTAWDTSGWRRTQTFKGHRRDVARTVFSPDGATIYGGGSSDVSPFDNSVRAWEASTGAELHRWDAYGSVCAMAISPDGTSLAVATVSGQTMLLEASSLTPLWPDPPEARTSALAFTPDGRLLGTLNHALLLDHDLGTGAQRPLVPALRVGVALATTADGSAVFVGCGSGGSPEGALVAAIDRTTDAVAWSATLGPAARPCGVAVSSDGRRLYVAHAAPDRLLVFER